jgi:proteasome lid subunit RPN8/RPN11
MFSCDDLDKLDDENVVATFHTHPNKSSNLSKEDYDAFVNWEKLLHFIIGKDKISCYKVSERGTVIVENKDVC